MVRSFTLTAIKRLMRLVRTDGKTSTNGIQQALGMFTLIAICFIITQRGQGRVYCGTWFSNDSFSSFKLSISSSIIQQVAHIQDTGLASMAYFYCDFRDSKKQEVTGLLTSLVAQLSAKSDACYDILS